MRQTAYGNSACHIDEHAAVLRSLDEVREALSEGHKHVVRSFALALANWFPGHAQVAVQVLEAVADAHKAARRARKAAACAKGQGSVMFPGQHAGG